MSNHVLVCVIQPPSYKERNRKYQHRERVGTPLLELSALNAACPPEADGWRRRDRDPGAIHQKRTSPRGLTTAADK